MSGRGSGSKAAWAGAIGLALGAAILAAAFAPYLFVEYSARFQPHAIVDPSPAVLAKGRMLDDYWAVQQIDADTFAIGEPRYYQQNYAYLILGRSRALLFDGGTGTRDIRPVVAGLTRLPVTVMASHLHFDHLGGVPPFTSVAMIDLPQTRADVRAGRFTPGRYEYLGLVDARAPPTVNVTEWLAPGARIDLGGRVLQVISTPGHTPNSVSLFDQQSRQLFSGDYVYPTTLYAFLPGASIAAYRDTTRRLLAMLPADTMIWTAHCCRVGEKASAPWLTMADLADLDRALSALKDGRLQSTGFYPRRFPVNRQMTLATGFAWNNR
jgi:hydroxyacylglutathione hydrolase